jgi:hypothetical protein
MYYSGECMYMLHDLDGACSDWRESAHMGDADGENNYKRMCLTKSGKPRFKKRIYGQF